MMLSNPYVLAIITIALITVGWEARGWKDNSALANAVIKQEASVAKGASNIIKNDQNIRTVYVKVHDDCIAKPLPDSVRKLLLN